MNSKLKNLIKKSQKAKSTQNELESNKNKKDKVLKSTSKSTRSNQSYYFLQNKLKASNFPNQPGVYIFSDENGAIYVGKAKNLKKRVAYYFKLDQLPKRLLRMVSTATNLQYFITQTEQDALLLEAQFIKEKQPLYNIMYKHGRSLYYINCSKHPIARVEIINEWVAGAVGPFLSIEYIKNLLSDILKIFKLRTCSDYVFVHRKRPCLEYHANRCSAPCVGLINQLEYAKNQKALIEFFKGKSVNVVKQWKLDLKNAIKLEEFEKAAKINSMSLT